VKWLILLLFPTLVFASGNHSENSHGGDTSSDAGSSSTSGYEASNDSRSVVVIGIDNQHRGEGSKQGDTNLQGGNTALTVTQEHDPVANSAGGLSVDYCVQGISGQGKDGGLIIAGSDPVCRQTRMIGAAIPEIQRLRAKGDPRADELSGLVTDTVFTMFEDEEDRRKADQSFNLFKAVGPWLLTIVLFF